MLPEEAGPGPDLPTPGLKGRMRTAGREFLRSLYLLPRLPAGHMGLGVLPSFIVVGAQKSGTTSLFRYLARDPGVKPPRLKEVHFFDLHWQKGLPWYRAHFPFSFPGRRLITGEASPYYLFHPRVPERMARVLPGVKIIVLLRNPVDRALSHYHWEVAYGNESRSFREAIRREEEVMSVETERLEGDGAYRSFVHQHTSYLSRGRYAEQLSRWLTRFPREQILVLKAEEFFLQTGEVMARVRSFLHLAESPNQEFPIHRKGRYEEDADVPRTELTEYFRPLNRDLADLLGMDFGEWG